MTLHESSLAELDLIDQREKVVDAAKTWFQYMTNVATAASVSKAHHQLVEAIRKLIKAEDA